MNKINFFAAFLILTIFLFVACTNEKKLDEKKYSEEFRGYAKEYLMGLKSVLMKNMHDGGPVKAITVCSDTASDLTKMYSEVMKMEVKRVSLKNRNADNFPDSFEKESISEFEKLLSENKLNDKSEIIKIVSENEQEFIRYVKPIIIEAPCLNCHGSDSEITPEVKSIIKKNYPNDKAVDYKIGDLRGVISITKTL